MSREPSPRGPVRRSARTPPPRGRRTAGARAPRGSSRRPPSPGGFWLRRIGALLALVVIGVALYLINATFQPFHGDGRGTVAVRVPEGADAGRIGTLLADRGVIASPTLFNVNATLTNRRGKLRSGRYELARDMSNGAAIEALMQGPTTKAKVVRTFTLTIPEGRSRREVVPLVERSDVRGSYLAATQRRAFLRRARSLGAPSGTRTLEGFLFPATYELRRGASARTLVDRQLDAYAENIDEVNLSSARRRNLTRYDILIIASMVEREASLDRERPLVAAVIHNRLREGIPLGIDATIRYAEDNWTRPLRESELARPGPFNTRLNQGLPPTPIGSPGLASLKAAARPARKGYLYYVVKPGTCGEHAFSSSDAEFQRDVARYNAERERRGGKSPTDC